MCLLQVCAREHLSLLWWCTSPKDVPAKGLILAPFHVPVLLNDSTEGPKALGAVSDIAAGVRGALRAVYGLEASLKHVIWIGMGGSIEDKYAGIAVGLLPQDKVQLWCLDDVNGEAPSVTCCSKNVQFGV